jgi:hypothetical protein
VCVGCKCVSDTCVCWIQVCVGDISSRGHVSLNRFTFCDESGEKSLAGSGVHSFLFRCLKLLLMQPINRVTTLPRMIIFANL